MHKTLKKAVSCILTVCMLLTLALPAFAEDPVVTPGDTADNPILISDAAGLTAIVSDKHYKLENDIDMAEAVDFVPLTLTTGSLDGADHVIRNLTISAETGDAAFFASIGEDAAVRNTYLIDASVTATAGAAAGFALEAAGTIANCGFAGTVKGAAQAAGFIGTLSGTVTDSYSVATVLSDSAALVLGETVGAIVPSITYGTVADVSQDETTGSDGNDSTADDSMPIIGTPSSETDDSKIVRFAVADQTIAVNGTFTAPYTTLPGVTAILTDVTEGDATYVSIQDAVVTGTAIGTAALNLNLAFGQSVLDLPFTVTVSSFSAGSGTQNDPYIIETAEQLQGITELAYYKIKDGVTELDLGGQSWTPIVLTPDPDAETPATAGGFDGNQAILKNLTIEADVTSGTEESATQAYLGLFGDMSGYPFTLSKVRLQDVNITATVGSFDTVTIGAVAARLNGTLENSFATGKITVTQANTEAAGSAIVGGLVGTLSGEDAAITRCFTDLTMDAADAQLAGGIVANNAGEVALSYMTGSIANAQLAGGISAISDGTTSGSYVAGSFQNNDEFTAFGVHETGSLPDALSNCYYDKNQLGDGEDTAVNKGAGTVSDLSAAIDSTFIDSIRAYDESDEDAEGSVTSMSTYNMTNDFVPVSGSSWVTKEQETSTYYYPQLAVFAEGVATEAVKAISLASVTTAPTESDSEIREALISEANKYSNSASISRGVRVDTDLTTTIAHLKSSELTLDPDIEMVFSTNNARDSYFDISNDGKRISLRKQNDSRYGNETEIVILSFSKNGLTYDYEVQVTLASNYTNSGSGSGSGSSSGGSGGSYYPGTDTTPTPAPSASADPSTDLGADVPSDFWAKDAIDKLVDEGIIQGDEGTGFIRPTENIKREEVAALLLRAQGIAIQTGGTLQEGDPSSEWAIDTLYTAQQAGIMNGDDLGNFNGQHPALRSQVVVMVARCKNVTSDNLAVLDQFADGADIPDWAKPSVAGMIEQGYLTGYDDNTLRMNNNITRAETFALIERLLLAE